MAELFTTLSNLTNAEVDEKLENAVVLNMKTERLICCYLSAMRERGAYRDFGFSISTITPTSVSASRLARHAILSFSDADSTSCLNYAKR